MNGFQLFSTLCSSNERLTMVEGQMFHHDGLSMLIGIRLTFGRMVVALTANEDDTIEIHPEGELPNDENLDVREITSHPPWTAANHRPLLWVWRMINQQGYFDGIQFEFSESLESESTRIQVLCVGSELKPRFMLLS